MNKTVCRVLVGLALAMAVLVGRAEARAPCPPGYYWDGPRGCMPYGPYAPPPPPGYYTAPCPPGTVWTYGACRPYAPPPPPPPPPGVGIYIPVPPIFIAP